MPSAQQIIDHQEEIIGEQAEQIEKLSKALEEIKAYRGDELTVAQSVAVQIACAEVHGAGRSFPEDPKFAEADGAGVAVFAKATASGILNPTATAKKPKKGGKP